jgi:hypothetical protein
VQFVSILLDKIVRILAINHQSSVAINERRFGPKKCKGSKESLCNETAGIAAESEHTPSSQL